MDKEQEVKLFKIGLLLSILTFVFNLLEGVVSVYFGYKDETLTLFGFGVDSFIETIGIIYLSVKEGTEAFEKAKSQDNCNC